MALLDSVEKKVPSIVVEMAVAILILGGVMGSIWIYSGQPFPGSPPLVVIESGSMMHDNEPFGRIGTIDPGDIVLAKAVHSVSDVVTHGGKFGGGRFVGPDGYKTYGDYGDVIIYKPLGRTDVLPIIHRAMCWVEYDETTHTYTVEEYGIKNATSVTIPELDLYGYQPDHSGFITKGDNNEFPDQHPMARICEEPVKLEWVIGKAQGELPWFGALKLLFTGTAQYVEFDCWVCLALSITILISIPLSFDIRDYIREKKGATTARRKGWIGKLKTDRVSRLEVLKSTMILYWFVLSIDLVMTLLFISNMFALISGILSIYVLMLILTLILHVSVLALVYIDGRYWKTKNLWLWIVLIIFTGPVGFTVYYYSTQNEKPPLDV